MYYIKRLLKYVVVLAAILLLVIFLRGRAAKRAEAEDARGAAPEELAAETPGNPSAFAVMSVSDGVRLGRLTENTEIGGVDITVENADGAGTVYTFRDVAIDRWYADAVNFVVSAGLMTGVSENEPVFRPEYGVMRESFAMILCRFAGGEAEEAHFRFEDVGADEWYAEAVNWVANRQLMTGSDAKFGIGEYMTVEQALIGVYRLAGEPEADASLVDYPYAPKVSEAGRKAVGWAWNNGLISEVECVWYPTQAISRAQAALLLLRYSTMAS